MVLGAGRCRHSPDWSDDAERQDLLFYAQWFSEYGGKGHSRIFVSQQIVAQAFGARSVLVSATRNVALRTFGWGWRVNFCPYSLFPWSPRVLPKSAFAPTPWTQCASHVCVHECSAVQCSAGKDMAVQCRARVESCSAVPCCALQDRTGQDRYRAVLSIAVQCSAVLSRTGHRRALQRSAVQCSAVQCSAGQRRAAWGRCRLCSCVCRSVTIAAQPESLSITRTTQRTTTSSWTTTESSVPPFPCSAVWVWASDGPTEIRTPPPPPRPCRHPKASPTGEPEERTAPFVHGSSPVGTLRPSLHRHRCPLDPESAPAPEAEGRATAEVMAGRVQGLAMGKPAVVLRTHASAEESDGTWAPVGALLPDTPGACSTSDALGMMPGTAAHH